MKIKSNRRVIGNFKRKKNFKEEKKIFLIKKIVKIYLGISLELLRAVWVWFSF